MNISGSLNEPMIQRRLSDVIYDALLEAIVTGALEPGQTLHDRDLARELDVSRTPVREALQRMQETGLVEIAPGRYTRVATVDREHLAQVCRVVGQMISLAVEVATPALQAADIDYLRAENSAFLAAVERGQALDSTRRARAFYGVFVERADNPVLATNIARLWPQVARWTAINPGWKSLDALTKTRRRILVAARNRNGIEAAGLVRELWVDLAESIVARPDAGVSK